MNYLLIDCPNLCHRAFHTTGKLANGTMFGFLRELQTLRQEYPKSRFIFFWDSKHPIRADLCPGYKASRKERFNKLTDEEKEAYEEMRGEMGTLRLEILWDLGYKNVRWQKGYEADDLIADFIQRRLDPDYIVSRKGKIDSFLIVSTDQDFYQLLEPRVQMLKQRLTYGVSDFRKNFGIDPSQWACCKAIVGCPTDDVSGVKGVGLITAIKYLKGQLKSDSNMAKRIEEGKEIINRNHKLVRLPLHGVKYFQVQPDDPTHKRWNKIVRDLGMKTLLGSLV